MANIVGGVTSINNPRTNWAQTDAKKADFLKNKPSVANALKGHKSGASISADDVSPVEHELDVKVRSKNLLPDDYFGTGRTVTSNGVTFVFNDDGSITFNGTATGGQASTSVTPTKDWFITEDVAVFTGIPMGSGLGKAENVRLILEVVQPDGTTAHRGSRADHAPNGGIIEKGSKVRRVYLAVANGYTANNITFHPQLEYGTVPTEFTPPSMDVEGVNVTVTDGENSQTATADAEGNVKGLMSLSPNMTLTTDNVGAVIECEYNRDADKVITDLETKLNTLIATIGG